MLVKKSGIISQSNVGCICGSLVEFSCFMLEFYVFSVLDNVDIMMIIISGNSSTPR